MLKIGSHVSFSGKGLLNAANEAAAYGSSTFMIYTGAPQNTRRKSVDELYIPEGKEVMAENGINEIVVHAPYIINLGSFKDQTYRLAVDFLQEEVRRTHKIGVKNIVLHPGAFTEKDVDYGIARIAEGLNEVLEGTKETDVNIALETMAGKGTEIGRSFEELARIINLVEANDRLTVCMDTCHIHDAGYDIVNGVDGVLKKFDDIVGLDRIAVVHVNDSKNPLGSGKDRHAVIGSGMIGYQGIAGVVGHELLKDKPFILETPWIGKSASTERPMYEAEIALLRRDADERFGGEFMEDVERLHHFFDKEDVHPRLYVMNSWEQLKAADAKTKKADPREPMERLYDMLIENRVLTEDYSEEAVNQRLLAWLAGKEWLASL
ncbi:deoxyribonuclease IV [Cohnella kolymensis]|uniref:Probable endonuclease 4 n=1 Tax=Cohnella kolymensis TaxID=1590652 RepID=A0ABR5A4C2_9BACL|nr:deoxyribonuclease IV [Cohnella kolymensis]KIL35893.1 deoxyribonuclease IV [Cohnella kolymensis]